jgi:hypothetical protein
MKKIVVRNNLVVLLFFLGRCALSQTPTVSREATAIVPPTQWSVTINSPPCNLQVYIGRVNTTRESSSCVVVCVDPRSLPSGTQILSIKLFSREEGANWQEGAVGWAAWEQVNTKQGCAVFKNWSNNRFREAKVLAVFGVSK